MRKLRFAILGTGFWSRFQLAGWRELDGVECVAVYNRTRQKAELLAQEAGIPPVYDDADELMGRETLDFVDIISDVGTHSRFVHQAIQHRLPVICQKPMAPSWQEACDMVEAARQAKVPIFIHENWRWQPPIRALKQRMQEESLGELFRARITFSSAFPVFDNQPFLKELGQFILTDIGSHILDTARYLFGEVKTVFCRTCRTRADIQGENVATVLLEMESGMSVTCEMNYAGQTRHECFPQTRILVEGTQGSLELEKDYWIHLTKHDVQRSQRYAPPHYAWADAAYDVVHSSIVDCNRNLLQALRGTGPAETTGQDNLETMRLVFSCYESAARGEVVHRA